ncbi:MAG: hypothetical protein IRZ07_03780 [Microbispora sp.]|nr:hypothetical protein [Microbispora sp.]
MAVDWDALVLAPCMAAFGEPVSISWDGGAALTIPDAVFDRQHVEIQFPDGRAPLSGWHPVLGIRAAALPDGVSPRQLDRVVVRDEEFQVVDVQPDGAGHILLILATP